MLSGKKTSIQIVIFKLANKILLEGEISRSYKISEEHKI